MPDLSHERERLYALVDKFIDQQKKMEHEECTCEEGECMMPKPVNVRVATAAIVVGVNYELANTGDTDTYQSVFTTSESRDQWTTAGLVQSAADSLRREIVSF